jgi:hypothetical protein
VVNALGRDRSAVDAPELAFRLQLRQIPSDRLGGDVETSREISHLDRTVPERQQVDLTLSIVLEPGVRGEVGHRVVTLLASDGRA